MSVFPSAAHLASWGGLSPGNHESAGQKKNARTRKGNKGLKSMLCQSAWAAIKAKKTRLSAFYYRLVKRRGPKKAIMAVAHLMLRIIYVLLQKHVDYNELGSDYLPKKERDLDFWIRKIQNLGYKVDLHELKAIE
jgi:transposase